MGTPPKQRKAALEQNSSHETSYHFQNLVVVLLTAEGSMNFCLKCCGSHHTQCEDNDSAQCSRRVAEPNIVSFPARPQHYQGDYAQQSIYHSSFYDRQYNVLGARNGASISSVTNNQDFYESSFAASPASHRFVQRHLNVESATLGVVDAAEDSLLCLPNSNDCIPDLSYTFADSIHRATVAPWHWSHPQQDGVDWPCEADMYMLGSVFDNVQTLEQPQLVYAQGTECLAGASPAVNYATCQTSLALQSDHYHSPYANTSIVQGSERIQWQQNHHTLYGSVSPPVPLPPPDHEPRKQTSQYVSLCYNPHVIPALCPAYTGCAPSAPAHPPSQYTADLAPVHAYRHQPEQRPMEPLTTKTRTPRRLAKSASKQATKTRSDRSMCFRCRKDKQTCNRTFDEDCYRCNERGEPCVKIYFKETVESGSIDFTDLVRNTSMHGTGEDILGTQDFLRRLSDLEASSSRHNFTTDNVRRLSTQHFLPTSSTPALAFQGVTSGRLPALSNGPSPIQESTLTPRSSSDFSVISSHASPSSLNSQLEVTSELQSSSCDGGYSLVHCTPDLYTLDISNDTQTRPITPRRQGQSELEEYVELEESLKRWPTRMSAQDQSTLLRGLGLSLNTLRWRWSWCGLLSDEAYTSAFRDRVYRLARTIYFHYCNVKHELEKQDYSAVVNGIDIVYANIIAPTWHVLPSEAQASVNGFDEFLKLGVGLISFEEQALIFGPV